MIAIMNFSTFPQIVYHLRVLWFKIIIEFMQDRNNTVELMDPNHQFKSVWRQIILDASINTIGLVLINPGILFHTYLPKNVIIIHNFIPDTKVLQFVSWGTIKQLLKVQRSDDWGDQVAVFGLMMMFLRLFNDMMNSKTMTKKFIFFEVWYSFLWFLSI